jgi:hypothetical protein
MFKVSNFRSSLRFRSKAKVSIVFQGSKSCIKFKAPSSESQSSDEQFHISVQGSNSKFKVSTTEAVFPEDSTQFQIFRSFSNFRDFLSSFTFHSFKFHSTSLKVPSFKIKV